MRPPPLSPLDSSLDSSPYSPRYVEVDSAEEPLQELTLDALRMAFVEVDDTDSGHGYSEDEKIEEGNVEDVVIPTNPETVLEAILFVGNSDNSPMTVDKCCELLRNVTPEEIRQIVDTLNLRYETVRAPQRIIWERAKLDNSGGSDKSSESGKSGESDERFSLRMVLHDSFHGVVEKLSGKARETQLSQVAIDVLSVVAYRQPMTADEIQQIRKTSVGSLLSQLVRRELLTADTIQKGNRNVTQYRTTKRFLDIFGLSSLADLPTADEMEARFP